MFQFISILHVYCPGVGFNFISEVAFLGTDQPKRDGQAQEFKWILIPININLDL